MRLFLNILIVTAVAAWLVGLIFFNFDWGIHGVLFIAADLYIIKLLIIELSKRKDAQNNYRSSKM
ncbi:MAG: hypothetical protein R3359_08720 [Marinirhabdus sp.]|nr:hypothetical protein [Marinirhabdus sp.]